ncbi:tRNA (N6-isopentenyl adenosine(37)-C2)-methylthiotransferase MiaB [Pedobacter sp. LMG 31464]|uniref:tRNA-2-methylthio-N(6)-dimethylallyladenosine synthase n=1 Tax=Pedobacter planticolens TaxID=2679964 RepID=A0A923E0T2_9SPHI|nr:MiaB/RimO family radical SAM methylthiotransferase [Pedobacter planticolens]MBB2146605.1 tRNA (N6-isopentenyl adenosine(37)-C2)-methylthiotransferase MiaB [Pedobacter planticolens]
MIDLQLTDKKHDEERQGEALVIDAPKKGDGRKLYIESYGCQMNFADSEIVASILADTGFETTGDYHQADVIFINTCSIRENAEQRVRNRLSQFGVEKRRNPKLIVGVLGCMAERLKAKFLEEEKLVDVVVGPDAYRDLPGLISQVEDGHKAVNVILSREETYADVSPVRLNSNGITAFVTIMRGCDNMCSFCVVPFTRGRERSRDPFSIIKEAKELFENGYREVTLLGQNVDSYHWKPIPNPSRKEGSSEMLNQTEVSDKLDFMNTLTGDALLEALTNKTDLPATRRNENELTEEGSMNFAQLLSLVAEISPELRVRFSTSHPKDITDEVLYTIAKHDNICNYIHLPVQSGNSRILALMNRTYTREWYMNRIDAIRRIIPGCAISADIIAGFCTETEEEHQDTLSIMDYARYNFAYTFSYSERPGTLAARKYPDDIPEDVKARRLAEIFKKQQEDSLACLEDFVGKTVKVLIEGFSKKSDKEYRGRNDENAMVVFPVTDSVKPGDYANVFIERCTSATLLGRIEN